MYNIIWSCEKNEQITTKADISYFLLKFTVLAIDICILKMNVICCLIHHFIVKLIQNKDHQATQAH